MGLATHQILGIVLLYFLIGYIISIPVVKGVQEERSKNLLKSKKLPSDRFVRNLIIFLWPIAVIMSLFKKRKEK
jgi:hypothetical protein